MKLTRDGALPWVLAGAALVGYLVTTKVPPTQWDYMMWLNFAAWGFGWLAGKLGTSPAPSSGEVARGFRDDGRPIASILLVLGLSGALLSSGCAKTPPDLDPTRNLSPEARLAYHAMKVGKVLDVLRDVAAEAEKQNPKLLSPRSALKVITYHKQIVTTMAAAPGGWRAIALMGLEQLKTDLSADEWRQLEPFVNLLRVLIGVV